MQYIDIEIFIYIGFLILEKSAQNLVTQNLDKVLCIRQNIYEVLTLIDCEQADSNWGCADL